MSTDFSSIDKLVEFGMGMALAHQMVDTMNHSMNNMQIAGVNAGTTGQATLQTPPQTQWYAVVEGKQVGPATEKEVVELIAKGHINSETLMWCPGRKAWSMVQDIPEINKLILLNS